MDTNNTHIIGLTGSFGSGCSYIAEHIIKDKEGYHWRSLSRDVLRPLFRKKTGKDPDDCPKRELQEFGDKIREQEGHGYFAEKIAKIIVENPQKDGNGKWVIDSIRNPAEVRAFRKEFANNFFLFGVYAEKEDRWKRVESVYDRNRRLFDSDDENDTGEDNPSHGQKVGNCFYEADVVITNDKIFDAVGNAAFQDFAGQVKRYIDLTEQPLRKQQPIRQDETIMAMAYATSQRSSCDRRKVGTIIVDSQGNVISSGFNEVPIDDTPCLQKFKMCHREKLTNEFFESLQSTVPEVVSKAENIKLLFKKKFKILDYCRALHAEENAIVNLARNGRSVPLSECVLYTTTYPCRMCANKIANLGIKEMVYLEPYPDQSAKSILKGKVKDRFFNGVTFRAYFRLYGEEK